MRAVRYILLCIPLALACSKSGPRTATEKLPPRLPSAVVIDREITGPLLNLELNNPCGLAVDMQGAVYLCDQGNNRIVKLQKDLRPLRDRGGFGSQDGLFNAPRFVSLDNQLNLWISDTENRRIVRLDGDLNFVDRILYSDATDPLRFGIPSGVAATSFGALWIADKDKDCVTLFDNVGQFEKFVGDFGSTGGQLQDPEKIVCDNDETFYVCDPGNSRVAIFDSYGTLNQSLTDDNMVDPVAVTLDRRGSVWVLDQSSQRLFCFDRDGNNLASGGVELVGGHERPISLSDLAFLVSDSLLISDGGGNRLLVCNVIYK